jgi:hypothetical protein
VYLGIAAVIGGATIGTSGTALMVLGLLGIVLAASGMLLLAFRVRCPRCRSRLGQILGNVGSPFTISRRLRFCPFCGVPLDSPMPGGRPE